MDKTRTMDFTRSLAPWRSILGYSVANLGYEEALELLSKRIAARQYTPVTFLNAHNANVAGADQNFAQALPGFLVLPDGIGVDVASKSFHGAPFKANLNGTDLVPALFSYCIQPLKVALIGARPDVIKAAQAAFTKETPWHEFKIVSDGFFRPQDLPHIKQLLKDMQPDILLVAMGVPRQEEFIAKNLGPEFCTMPMAVGALLDFHSGMIPRAPKWVRDLRSEWVYRLLREPKRLWYRYIVGNPVFLINVLRSHLKKTSVASGNPLTQSPDKAK
ncbi:MAG: WecB/TagA/CpsF family glycosyltransferase [Rhizobiaceae bacterium]